MAKQPSIERQQQRLRLKAEQLNLRIKVQDSKDKLKNVTAQLKSMGGRIR